MKTETRTRTATATPFDRLPKEYLGLCQKYVPRPLHDAADYAAARQAIEPLLGFESRLTADQADYLEAVSSFIEAYDQTRVKWPKGTPLDTLNFLLTQHDLTAADLSRLLGDGSFPGAEDSARRTPPYRGTHPHAGPSLEHRTGRSAVMRPEGLQNIIPRHASHSTGKAKWKREKLSRHP